MSLNELMELAEHEAAKKDDVRALLDMAKWMDELRHVREGDQTPPEHQKCLQAGLKLAEAKATFLNAAARKLMEGGA